MAACFADSVKSIISEKKILSSKNTTKIITLQLYFYRFFSKMKDRSTRVIRMDEDV